MNYFVFGYANSIADLTAEMLAFEGLSLLTESQILSGYVATDFNEMFAEQGDIVKAAYPVEMTADRVPEGDPTPFNNLTSGSHQVKLNQLISQAFSIPDREQQRSFVEIVDFYIAPAIRSMSQMADRIVQGEKYKSYKKTVGKIGTPLAYTDILAAGKLQTLNNVPSVGRNLFVGANAGADIRNMDKFINNVSATDPSVVRSGAIGSINGYVAHETNSFTTVSDSTKRSGTAGANEPKAETSIALSGVTGAIVNGSWALIAGVPYRITGSTGGASPTAFTIEAPGLREDVASGAAIHIFTPSAVNHPSAGNYAAGHEGAIGWDGAVTPQVGQGVTFGTGGDPYSIIKVVGGNIWLNRPLDAQVNNDADIFLMPGGDYGLALWRSSIQLVNRPLRVPPAGRGVDAYTAIGNGWSLRVMSQYDIDYKTTKYSFDFLMGIATIDENANVVVLG